MPHLTRNLRIILIPALIKLVEDILDFGFNASFPIARLDKKAATNVSVELEKIFEAEKSYKIHGSSFTGEQVVGHVEAWERNNKEGYIIEDGRRRSIACVMCDALFGVKVKPVYTVVKEGTDTDLRNNMAYRNVQKMGNLDELIDIVAKFESGLYKKQGDIPCGRGLQQKYYWNKELVAIHKIPAEKAIKLTWQKSKEACEGTPPVLEAVDAFIAEKGKGNNEKVMPGKELREGEEVVAKSTVKPEQYTEVQKAVLELHGYIVSNNPTKYKQFMVRMFPRT